MAEGIINIIREWLYGPEVPKEPKECESCETLREQLTFANYDRKVLMEHILKQAFPEKQGEVPIDLESLKPMHTGKKPWRVRQQELQEESRKRAEQIRYNAEQAAANQRSSSGGLTFPSGPTIEQLEKEMSLAIPANSKGDDNGLSGQDHEGH